MLHGYIVVPGALYCTMRDEKDRVQQGDQLLFSLYIFTSDAQNAEVQSMDCKDSFMKILIEVCAVPDSPKKTNGLILAHAL